MACGQAQGRSQLSILDSAVRLCSCDSGVGILGIVESAVIRGYLCSASIYADETLCIAGYTWRLLMRAELTPGGILR